MLMIRAQYLTGKTEDRIIDTGLELHLNMRALSHGGQFSSFSPWDQAQRLLGKITKRAARWFSIGALMQVGGHFCRHTRLAPLVGNFQAIQLGRYKHRMRVCIGP